MRIFLELDVIPHDGGKRTRFYRRATWDTVPRVGDHIELADGWADWPVQRVTFTARNNVRIQLKTLHDDHHDLMHDLRTHEKSKWTEKDDDTAEDEESTP